MTVWTFLTAIVASSTALWIAYRVYPWQKSLDRELQVEAEKRKVVAQLISALEALTLKVSRSNAVGKKTVSYFSDEIAAVDAAIGLAIVYDLEGLSEVATVYKKAVLEWRNKILVAKKKRPADFKPGVKRPADYATAMKKVDDQFGVVSGKRQEFLDAATAVFGVKNTVSALSATTANEINEAEPAK